MQDNDKKNNNKTSLWPIYFRRVCRIPSGIYECIGEFAQTPSSGRTRNNLINDLFIDEQSCSAPPLTVFSGNGICA